MIKKIFSSDTTYKEMTLMYKKADGLFALAFYVVYLAMYYFMGALHANNNIYLGIPVNIVLTAACIGFVLIRKQKLSSLGITLRKIKSAAICGLALGILLILFNNIIPSVSAGNRLAPVSQILYNVFYYFIIIAIPEELVFRGFIQTRIYGLIRNDYLAVLVGALLFSAMHIPYQMAAKGSDFLVFVQENYLWLLLLVMWHVVINFLYRRFNSLAAPTIFHGFMNFGSSIFL